MFHEFYGLREQPFGVTPDPRFLYLSPSHREAIASLYCAIENGRGFSALIAKPGMGKTSILFRLLETLKPSTRMAFLFQPECNSPQFFQSLMQDLGLEVSNDIVRMRDSLNRLLLAEHDAGRRFVIVIDEAQNLSSEVLESVRLLSNFETPTHKLLHIILSGQPQLAATLARPDMVQLSQRVSAPALLEPLSVSDTKAYIRHRLTVAGHSGPGIFTDDAEEHIARLSEGIPRNISSMCFQAMSIGCALQRAKIDVDILNEVVGDLRARGEIAGERKNSFGNPATNESWTVPEMPGFLPASLPRPIEKRRAWKLGLAMSCLVLLSVVAWSFGNLRWRPWLEELVAKAEVQQPLRQDPKELPSANVKPPEVLPPVTQAGAAAATDDGKNESGTGGALTENRAAAVDQSAVIARPTPPARSVRIMRVPARKKRSQVIEKQTLPRVIYVKRSETLFEVALENYGKSNWDLVHRIRVENPSLKDPYAILLKGQRLVLPEVPTNELGDRSSKERQIG